MNEAYERVAALGGRRAHTCLPVFVSLVIWALLHARCSRPEPTTRGVAWLLVVWVLLLGIVMWWWGAVLAAACLIVAVTVTPAYEPPDLAVAA